MIFPDNIKATNISRSPRTNSQEYIQTTTDKTVSIYDEDYEEYNFWPAVFRENDENNRAYFRQNYDYGRRAGREIWTEYEVDCKVQNVTVDQSVWMWRDPEVFRHPKTEGRHGWYHPIVCIENISCMQCDSSCAGCTGCNACFDQNNSCDNACTGNCTSQCTTACTDNCTSSCTAQCQQTCFGPDVGCDSDCYGACVESCQTGCYADCVDGCDGSCNGGCADSCQDNCFAGCVFGCDGCDGVCVGVCVNGCVNGCADGCHSGCDGCLEACTGDCNSCTECTDCVGDVSKKDLCINTTKCSGCTEGCTKGTTEAMPKCPVCVNSCTDECQNNLNDVDHHCYQEVDCTEGVDCIIFTLSVRCKGTVTCKNNNLNPTPCPSIVSEVPCEDGQTIIHPCQTTNVSTVVCKGNCNTSDYSKKCYTMNVSGKEDVGPDPTDQYCVICDSSCDTACQGCDSACADSCDNCDGGSCQTACAAQCQGCDGSCQGSCTPSCAASCAGGGTSCTGCRGGGTSCTGCRGSCQGSCDAGGTECSGCDKACYGSCDGGCTGSCAGGCQGSADSCGCTQCTTYTCGVFR